MTEPFLSFADDSTDFNHNEKLIKEKAATRMYFDQQTLKDVQLE